MYRYKNIGILFVQSDNFVYLCHETLVKELKVKKFLSFSKLLSRRIMIVTFFTTIIVALCVVALTSPC